MTKSNSRRGWRGLERILLLAGIVGVGAWLGSMAAAIVGQSWDNWVFARRSSGESATVTEYIRDQQDRIASYLRSKLGMFSVSQRRPEQVPARPDSEPIRRGEIRTPANNELIGRLVIPRLQLMTTVREGTSDRTLALAAGHIRGTTLPGQNGNVGVAGHRDTFFRGLAKIRINDVIEFETMDARYTYQVASTTVVKPNDIGVLKAGLYPELTLVTCYPFDFIGAAPDRFIVKARQFSQNPRHAVQNPILESRLRETPKRPERTPERPRTDIPPAPRADLPGKVSFQISKSRSQQLAPGISVGVTNIDLPSRRVDGWVWIMPNRSTIWLRGRRTQDPLIFYQEGKRRELMIAHVTSSAASGYLLLR